MRNPVLQPPEEPEEPEEFPADQENPVLEPPEEADQENPEKEPPEEAPADQARSTLTGRRQGLRKLSPDLLSKASDETAKQVTRIGLTFFTTAAFCLLSLFSPDSALLGGCEKINVPLAGPVSFSGFMLLGPAVLIVLRIYLQIYVDHGDRLDRLAQRIPVVQAPTLVPLKNPLIRIFNALLFYLLLPGQSCSLHGRPPCSPAGDRVCSALRRRSSSAISCCRSAGSLGRQRGF